MKARRTSTEMYPLIEKWESSGQTREVFCTENNLTIGLFAYWRKKYVAAHSTNDKDSSASFIPIEFSGVDSSPVLELTVGSSRLTFYQLPTANYLKELLS